MHFAASMAAGVAAAAVTSPVDLAKTRLMVQQARSSLSAGAGGGPPPTYSGVFDVLAKTIKREGPLAIYKGFNAQWLRIGPHTIITFTVYERLRELVGMRAI